MRVLVIGQGGREHALAWVAAREGHEVHVAPGSDGIAAVATCHRVAMADLGALTELARVLAVELAIIGPEQPLVDGLADRLRAAGVATFGPSARAAELEGSKAEAKAFMRRYGIPTARHVVVSDREAAHAALATFAHPPVVKADGLAAGKGVIVPTEMTEAQTAVDGFLGGKLGAAGARVVLEERLHGREASFFVITDGTRCRTLMPAADHKRIGEGDTGPNTGGMGAYVPAPVFDAEVAAKTMDRIVHPTLAGLREERRPFIGVLFVGLMIDAAGDPWVIEYNVRFGDPEIQPLVVGLDDPLIEQLHAAASGTLASGTLAGRPAASVVLAAPGYPAGARTGDAIAGIDDAQARPNVAVFHAGTRRRPDGAWETAGGRVIGVAATGATLAAALEYAYDAAARIEFAGLQMRRDIGRALR